VSSLRSYHYFSWSRNHHLQNILSSHLCLGLPSILFPSGFSYQNPICTCALLFLCHLPWFDHPNNIWWGVHGMKLLIMHFSPFTFYFLLPPSPKYLLQPHVFEHCQPVFLPSVLETKFYTCTKQQAVLYISSSASRQQTGTQSILPWMSADIPKVHSSLNIFMHTVLFG